MPSKNSLICVLFVLGTLISVMTVMTAAMITVMTVMTATPMITIHVYRDNSVSINGTYTQRNSGNIPGELTVYLSVKEKEFTIHANADTSLSTVYNAYRQPFIEFTAKFHQVKENDVIRDMINIYANIWDNEGNSMEITLNPLETSLDLSNLTLSISGKANITATGKAKQAIVMLAMLDKDMIEQYLKTYNITGIRINELDTDISDDTALIKFDILVNLKEIGKEHMNTTEIANLRAVLARFAYPISGTISAKVNNKSIAYTIALNVEEDINEVLETINALYAISKFYKVETTPFVPSGEPPSKNTVNQIMSILDTFVRTFRILPSTSKIHIVSKDGVVTVEFTTPKIVKKGATSPKDTLMALYEFVNNVYRITEEASGIKLDTSSLYNTTTTLAPEAGVKLLLNGTEISSVKFSDIPSLEVVVEKPATATQGETNTSTGLQSQTRLGIELVTYGNSSSNNCHSGCYFNNLAEEMRQCFIDTFFQLIF